MKRVVLLALVPLALSGCTGIIYDLPGEDSDGGARGDAHVGDDGAASDGALPAVCNGVDCGPNGSCVDQGGSAACQCESGYHPDGLTCAADDPCEGVTCGVHAHCEDGDCVCDTDYEGDPVAGCTPIYSEEEMVRAELVTIAQAELGYCEGVDDRPYMWDQPGYWCYDFVAWVYNQVSYPLSEPYALTEYHTFNLPQGWRPEPGDLIKFHIQHYGMVASVSADGQTITTIEGNYSSCVRSRTITDSSVSYYGTLDDEF